MEPDGTRRPSREYEAGGPRPPTPNSRRCQDGDPRGGRLRDRVVRRQRSTPRSSATPPRWWPPWCRTGGSADVRRLRDRPFVRPPDLALLRRMMGRPRPPWAGRERLVPRQERRARPHPAGHHRHRGRRPAAVQRGRDALDHLQRGDLQLRRARARSCGGRGHRFRTASDTEVIVHAWEEWGTDCFSRFNGQWALALWDRRARAARALPRPPRGAPALLHARCRRLRFASEVKALFADPASPRALDPGGPRPDLHLLVDGRAAHGRSAASSSWSPGHYAVLDREGFRKAPLLAHRVPASGARAAAGRRRERRGPAERLVEATRLRFLRSDVRWARTCPAASTPRSPRRVIARYTDAPLHTFSLRFEDPEFDEGGYQKRMSARARDRAPGASW